ncbi:MAG: methylenetetrahydrofolate reductase [NAD(P)H] [Candidatus Omnitrophota bacterium]|nr:methylenetetrahydrofolate reductase [NAD(P)H] [Candidatus Omnitrophota bacterium]
MVPIMKKIIDIFNDKERTYSFEIFPPKTDKGYEHLLQIIEGLCKLNPDFISCTYGAGGGKRDKTFDIAEHIEKNHHVASMAHLTCVLNTKEEIKTILEDVKSRRIRNILALRGDPPLDNPHWQPTENNFKYSSELCAFIRGEYKDYFGIGVAGFPEGHILCKDKKRDAQYLKLKIDSGADFVITQLFFNNQDYIDYVQRLKKLNVRARIIPGILPITDYQNLQRFCNLCGATIPIEIKKIFEPLQGNPEETLNAGIDFAIRQCRDLLAKGSPGLHFYSLNKLSPVDKILNAVRI